MKSLVELKGCIALLTARSGGAELKKQLALASIEAAQKLLDAHVAARKDSSVSDAAGLARALEAFEKVLRESLEVVPEFSQVLPTNTRMAAIDVAEAFTRK